jgi:hypothetical protein
MLKMKIVKYLIALVFFAIFGGCAFIQPVVGATATPESTFGYVTGTFTRDGGGGIAFVLRNKQTGEEFSMPLGEDSALPKSVKDQIISIKVPPGSYAVTEWFTYATLTKERGKKNAITNQYLATPFTVDPGSVVYVGNYSVSTARTYSYPTTYIRTTITPKSIKSIEAREAFLKAYPSFGSNAFSCRFCTKYSLR